jgi:drug/metabolite transporter (DMT)-like permease
MALTWPIVLAVLCGAVLHAGWNALVKSSGDKEVDTALVHFLGALVALPPLLVFGLPPAAAWPYICASLAIHVAYYITLAGAYKHGDLGLTYPIMRGSAPLLVALGSSFVLGESLSPLAWIGVLAVTAGVALVGLARHTPRAPDSRRRSRTRPWPAKRHSAGARSASRSPTPPSSPPTPSSMARVFASPSLRASWQ